jgi:hypothetical protein
MVFPTDLPARTNASMFQTKVYESSGWAGSGTIPLEAWRMETFESFWSTRQSGRPASIVQQEREYFTYMRKNTLRTPGCAATAFLNNRAGRTTAPEALNPYRGEWRLGKDDKRKSEADMTFEEKMVVMSVSVSKFTECMIVHWRRYCKIHALPLDENSMRAFGATCDLDVPVSDVIMSSMGVFVTLFPGMSGVVRTVPPPVHDACFRNFQSSYVPKQGHPPVSTPDVQQGADQQLWDQAVGPSPASMFLDFSVLAGMDSLGPSDLDTAAPMEH